MMKQLKDSFLFFFCIASLMMMCSQQQPFFNFAFHFHSLLEYFLFFHFSFPFGFPISNFSRSILNFIRQIRQRCEVALGVGAQRRIGEGFVMRKGTRMETLETTRILGQMSLAALKEKLNGYGVDTATPGLTGNQYNSTESNQTIKQALFPSSFLTNLSFPFILHRSS